MCMVWLKRPIIAVKEGLKPLKSACALFIFTIRWANFILKESRSSNQSTTNTSLDTQGSFFVRDADPK